MGVDFGLRRFRIYLVGAPDTITIVTDHQPLCPIFNKNRSGSIRTENMKIRLQDIDFLWYIKRASPTRLITYQEELSRYL